MIRPCAYHVLLVLSIMAPGYGLSQNTGTRGDHGVVEGDVYLVMENGDTKRGAGREVLLLRHGVLAMRDSACKRHFAVSTRRSDSLTAVARRSSDSASYYLWKRNDTASARQFYQAAQRDEEFADQARASEKSSAEQRRSSDMQRLLNYVVRRAGTGMNAHYRFADVPPGRYVVYSEWTINGVEYAWWAPVTVVPGRAVDRDLDNSVMSRERLLVCPANPG